TTLADLLQVFHRRHSLPVSGKDLVSTLHQRKNSTLPGALARADEGEKEQGRRVGQVFEAHPNGGDAKVGLEDSAHPSEVAASQPSPGPIGWKKLEDLSYVQAVLWIGSRLADGLAYAHEHQVIHRDLKPANVLLADDGQPLLLDFNLSDNLRLRSSVLAASVGGTLPYMAPEHLESFYGESA